jgi:hypothetical protein
MKQLSRFAILSILFLLPVAGLGQAVANKDPQLTEKEKQLIAAEALAAERRTFAVTQLLSLADEARSYSDLALRPRVLARVADTIWDEDSDTARRIFRRAWEAAEAADTEELNAKVEGPQMQMVTALRRMGGVDKRNEVLRAAARRDRVLADEFLLKLKEQAKDDPESKSRSSADDLERRLRLARNLLEDGAIDQAIGFATPALIQVNQDTIGFLSKLRPKRPEVADQRFTILMAQAEIDPASDANTVSLLSSYVFTPGYYIIYNSDGTSVWGFDEAKVTAPNIPPQIRAAFFKTAATILLRPLPPPEQDTTTSGRLGKYAMIRRLLPLFDQYAPDSATALRGQLTSIATEMPKGRLGDPNRKPQSNDFGPPSLPSPSDVLQRMQEDLDHAGTSKDRDWICRRAAAELAEQGDARAIDLSDKIDDAKMRSEVRGYVDFQLAQFVLKKKNVALAVSLAKKGALTHLQRGWAYLQAVRLLIKSEKPDQAEIIALLDETIAEARRMDAEDPDRARVMFGATTQFMSLDEMRTWDLLGESVKAANAAEKFTGEKTSIFSMPMSMKAGTTFEVISEEGFGIANILKLLARTDLNRTMEVAKSFKRDGPRAIAILAIAGATLEKPAAPKREP